MWLCGCFGVLTKHCNIFQPERSFRMDRARPKSNTPQIKRLAIIAAGVLSLVSGGFTIATIDFSTHRVERDKVSIETVQQGSMEVKVSANGQLLSKHIEQ